MKSCHQLRDDYKIIKRVCNVFACRRELAVEMERLFVELEARSRQYCSRYTSLTCTVKNSLPLGYLRCLFKTSLKRSCENRICISFQMFINSI